MHSLSLTGFSLYIIVWRSISSGNHKVYVTVQESETT